MLFYIFSTLFYIYTHTRLVFRLFLYFRHRKFAYVKKNAYLCTAKFALGSPTGANAGRPVGRAEAGVALSI